MNLAMWSGPRNLSTAMMYSFAQRADFTVWDEPFYAAYLAQTGLDHPMRDQVITVGETDSDKVIAACIGSAPAKKPHLYQKHMTQHMLPEFDRDWLAQVTNVFLIRHPTRVVASFAAKLENLTLDDIGFRQQVELFDFVGGTGQEPIVIDSADIRANPSAMLQKICATLGLKFDSAMLNWPKGGNGADGIWGAHWYGAVHKSIGFAGAEGPLPELSGEYARLAAAAMPFYQRLLPFAEKFAGR